MSQLLGVLIFHPTSPQGDGNLARTLKSTYGEAQQFATFIPLPRKGTETFHQDVPISLAQAV